MSIPKNPRPVKLITSFIYSKVSSLDHTLEQLRSTWGEMDLLERNIPFAHTKYYHKEMGEPLHRSFVSFKHLINRKKIVEAKLLTNNLENSLANEEGARTINVDPGYVTDHQVVLATCKNFSHRIYLEKGVFADLTLVFREGAYQSLPWSYPDYSSPPLSNILMKVRQKYMIDRDTYDKAET